MKVTLYIENQNEFRTAEVSDELSIGRTPAAQVVLADEGLSRVNTTLFIEGDEVLVTDENSTNGTFLNGEKIAGRPRLLRNGDRLKIGTHTNIRVQIDDGRTAEVSPPLAESAARAPVSQLPPSVPASAPAALPKTGNKPPIILIAAAAMTFLIIAVGGIALFLASDDGGANSRGSKTSATPAPGTDRIPVRVMDPLGAENEDSLDDLIASWETAEQELDTSTVADVTVMSTDADDADLTVPRSKLEEVKRRLETGGGSGPSGIRPAGLDVPLELSVGFRNQTRKLQEMKAGGYAQPMDFADLAAKRLSRDLIEMPMATDNFYLDVGGSAQDSEFTTFQFKSPQILPIAAPSVKYDALKRLADDFAGQRFDLNNPSDRREIRRRLLRMFQPRAKPILQKLAKAYSEKFNRPLRVTSLTRSMDYQILLNQGNRNSFRVTGEGSLPPHTSGCAFDLARKHMSVEEQNFMMQMLAGMEKGGELDALIEYGTNACFHIFIYYDGKPPR